MSNSSATPWTIACQAPLSMVFPRQEYWNGLPFLSLEDIPDPEIEPGSLGRWILYHWATWENPFICIRIMHSQNNFCGGYYFHLTHENMESEMWVIFFMSHVSSENYKDSDWKPHNFFLYIMLQELCSTKLFHINWDSNNFYLYFIFFAF